MYIYGMYYGISLLREVHRYVHTIYVLYKRRQIDMYKHIMIYYL